MKFIRKFVVRWEVFSESCSYETDDQDEAVGLFNTMKALAHNSQDIKSVSLWENVRLG